MTRSFWRPRWASTGTKTARCSGPETPLCSGGISRKACGVWRWRQVDLLYLHAPAEDAPLAETAGFFRELLAEGKTRAVGVSNLTVDQMEAFAAECPIAACQVRYNRLQREIEADILPWCRTHDVSVVAYEPLALGLLTGKFTRDHVFAEADWRRQSPLFAGEAWTRNLDEVERLRALAAASGCSVAQWAVGWTITRPGVTAALCGAKRPDQIRETAQAMFLAENWKDSED